MLGRVWLCPLALRERLGPPLLDASASEHSRFCVSIWHRCMGACGGQKRVLDPLEPKLQAVVSFLKWVLGIELGFSGRIVNVLNY